METVNVQTQKKHFSESTKLILKTQKQQEEGDTAMVQREFLYWVIGLSLLGSLFAHFVSAQESEGRVVSVSPRVGNVIDVDESVGIS